MQLYNAAPLYNSNSAPFCSSIVQPSLVTPILSKSGGANRSARSLHSFCPLHPSSLKMEKDPDLEDQEQGEEEEEEEVAEEEEEEEVEE